MFYSFLLPVDNINEYILLSSYINLSIFIIYIKESLLLTYMLYYM